MGFLIPVLVAFSAESSGYVGEAADGEEGAGDTGAASELGSGKAVVGEEMAAGMMIDLEWRCKFM